MSIVLLVVALLALAVAGPGALLGANQLVFGDGLATQCGLGELGLVLLAALAHRFGGKSRSALLKHR